MSARTSRRAPFALVGLLVASVGLAWLATEFGARLLLGPPLSLDKQIVFYRPAPWRTDARGAVRYPPNADIRTIAIYGNRVEYDLTFPTNANGFVDDRDYRGRARGGAERRIALVGDSFTAGFHGGTPWVVGLRERLQASEPGTEIYNLGVGATGFPNFWELLLSVEPDLDPDEIVFLFVTDDLYRPFWRPVVHEGAIYPCPVDMTRRACLGHRTRLFELPEAAESIADVFGLIRERGLMPPARGFREWLARNSHLGSLLFGAQRRDVRIRGRPRLEGWLARLDRQFGDRKVAFLQIPGKDEVAAGAYHVDLGGDFQKAGFEYVPLLRRCGFQTDDYYRVDGHFDAQGYARLTRCVEAFLRGRALPRGSNPPSFGAGMVTHAFARRGGGRR